MVTTLRLFSGLPRLIRPLSTMDSLSARAIIRPATVDDSHAIASIMQIGASEQIRLITIIGSPRLHRHIRQQIHTADSDEYLVGSLQGHIVGMAAWGHSDGTLMLNHIFLLPGFRGRGIGKSLVLDGLRRFHRNHEHLVGVDVFAENPRARSWYDSMGMQREFEKSWVQIPLDSISSPIPEGWTAINIPQADLDHTLVGFSQFRLRTSVRTYSIGRLGGSLFRCGGFDILNDPSALGALVTLDPSRDLLCIDRSESLTPDIAAKGRIVARSERMVATTDTLLDVLSSGAKPGVNL